MPGGILGSPETVPLVVTKMILENLVKPDSVLCNVSVRSKKHSLEILSELLTRSNPDIASEEVFAKLFERERLGCTGLNEGIAFPHCRISGLKKSCAALVKLLEPVDYLLRDDAMRARLRSANTSNDLYDALFAGQPVSKLQSAQ